MEVFEVVLLVEDKSISLSDMASRKPCFDDSVCGRVMLRGDVKVSNSAKH